MRSMFNLFMEKWLSSQVWDAPRRRRLLRAAASSCGMAAHKAVQVLVTLLTVPILLRYLGVELYGATMALIGLCALVLLDAGISEALKFRLIRLLPEGDRAAARHYVSTAFFATLLLAPIVVLTAAAIGWRLQWPAVLSLEHAAASTVSQIPWVVAICFVTVAGLIPLKSLKEIYTADQRGYVFSMAMAAGSILGLLAILVAVRLDLGWTGVVLALQVPVAAGYLLLGGYFLLIDRLRWLRPRLRSVRREAWREMRGDCGWLFLMSVAFLLINGCDVFLVNLLLGGDAATEFLLAVRFFLYGEMLLGFVLYPLWPMLGEALHSGDERWVRSVSRRLLVSVAVAAGTLYTCVALFGDRLVALWTGGLVTPDANLLYAILWAQFLVRAGNHCLTVLLRAHGRVRIPSGALAAEALLHVTLVVALCRWWGLPGVAAGGLLATVATQAWLLPWEYARTLRERRAG